MERSTDRPALRLCSAVDHRRVIDTAVPGGASECHWARRRFGRGRIGGRDHRRGLVVTSEAGDSAGKRGADGRFRSGSDPAVSATGLLAARRHRHSRRDRLAVAGGGLVNLFLLYFLLLKATLTSFNGPSSIPVLRNDFVVQHHILTDRQLNAAVVAGRCSPGPMG